MPTTEESSRQRVVVLGASGWIGREVGRFRAAGIDVAGATRTPPPGSGLAGVASGAELDRLLAASPATATAVINCAGMVVGTDDELEQANVDFARDIGEVCRGRGVRLIHVGSAAEYGAAAGDRIAETTEAEPSSAYGRSKLAATNELLALADDGLDVTVARLFNVVGPGQPESTPIGEFAAVIRSLPPTGGSIPVRNAAVVRDFVSLPSVARMLVSLAQLDARPRLVNVCSGRGLSFRELIEAMARVRRIEVHIQDGRAGGIPVVIGDPRLLHAYIGVADPEPADYLASLALAEDASA